MRAMLFEKLGEQLRLAYLPAPTLGPGQLLIHVRACAVCRPDLHVIDGELTQPKLPLILGHEIVGTVERFNRKGDARHFAQFGRDSEIA